MSKRERSDKRTFTKQTVRFLLIVAIIDLQLSYVLAFLGRVEIAETLSITVVTEIIAVMLGYYLKAFSETREEKRMAFKEKQQEEKREKEEKQEFLYGKKEVENVVVG